MIYTLCAGGGLRFGEALGIDIKNITPDCSIIKLSHPRLGGLHHRYDRAA
jgi:hypothetical protein